jgi:glycosyltransferase involved in cell wall biosynthesis
VTSCRSYAASVVVPAFEERHRVGYVLASLDSQDLAEPFEIIVVASGTDGCAEYLKRAHPEVVVVEHAQQLLPGAARNAGVRCARGEIIAFASADTKATSNWLAERLRVHRQGFDLVGGSILNGTPGSWVGTAGYLLEYSALLPIRELLEQQDIPHALSFRRTVFDQAGLYPEDLLTGEDTIFNRRCLSLGFRVGFAPGAGLSHKNPTRLKEFLGHAASHGRGLAQCVDQHALPSAINTPSQAGVLARAWGASRYVWAGLLAKYRRLYRFAPRELPSLVISTPLILMALAVTAWSASRRAAEPAKPVPVSRP